MALNKRTRTSSVSANVSAAKAEPNAKEQTKSPVTDMDALQKALVQVVQLVTELNDKLAKQTERADEFEKRLNEFEEKLNAALEDEEDEDEDADNDADDDEEDGDDDSDEEDGDDVTADDIDCNKAYKQLTSMDADQQKAVLVEAMKSLGVKSLQARTVRKDANAALAVAEVMCSDKFGWDVDDFLKD